MMFGGFGITELIVILVIVLLLFGTKKLRNLGSDLGSAIKGFRKAIASDDEPTLIPDQPADALSADDTTVQAEDVAAKRDEAGSEPKEQG